MISPAKRGSDRNRLRPGRAMIVGLHQFARPVGTVEPGGENGPVIGHLDLWVRLPNVHRCDHLIRVPTPAAIRGTTDENTGELPPEARRHLIDVSGRAIRGDERFPVIFPAPDALRIPANSGGGHVRMPLHIGLRGEVTSARAFLALAVGPAVSLETAQAMDENKGCAHGKGQPPKPLRDPTGTGPFADRIW